MTATLKSADDNPLTLCREELGRFFAVYPNPALHERAAKALRLLAAGDKPFAGKPEGWAAGAIYAVANLDRQACGVPGLLNAEFTEFFGVSMETVRRRAANVVSQISFW
jgi:hypothetical protein